MKTLSKCRLKIGLLGPFYLTVNETEIRTDAWKSKKALTLLKYFATRAGQEVSADVLIELLWPDNEDVDSTAIYIQPSGMCAGFCWARKTTAPPTVCQRVLLAGTA